MERVLSQDERIRRAEEIYARRQNIRERTKRATVNVAEPKNFRVLKRIALQSLICILMYFIFYLINTTNYSFSENVLSKTEEMLSNEIDFAAICTNAMNAVNEYIYSIEETEENTEEAQDTETTEEEEINIVEDYESVDTSNADTIENQEETIEIESTEISETDRIKQEYSFILPVTRWNCNVRIW